MAKYKPAYQEDVVIQVTVRLSGIFQPPKSERAALIRTAKSILCNSSRRGTFSICPIPSRCKEIKPKRKTVTRMPVLKEGA